MTTVLFLITLVTGATYTGFPRLHLIHFLTFSFYSKDLDFYFSLSANKSLKSKVSSINGLSIAFHFVREMLPVRPPYCTTQYSCTPGRNPPHNPPKTHLFLFCCGSFRCSWWPKLLTDWRWDRLNFLITAVSVTLRLPDSPFSNPTHVNV